MTNKNIYLSDLPEDLIQFLVSIDPIENEEWKKINDTRSRYFISNYGRVISLCGKPKLLKPYIRNHYESVKINNKNYNIHRLVAQYFIDNDIVNNRNVLVHHKDTNKTNNELSNLEVVSYQKHSEIHNKGVSTNDK